MAYGDRLRGQACAQEGGVMAGLTAREVIRAALEAAEDERAA